MQLTPAEKKGVASAAIVPTLWVTTVFFGLAAFLALQAQPSWWNPQGAVMTEQVVTNNGVVSTNYVPNNSAVANQGQLKKFTKAAVNELNQNLTNYGAGTTLSNYVYNWHQDYLTNNYATNTVNPYKPSDYQAVNVGQLKYIGRQVWGRLTNAGYAYALPTWLNQTNLADYSAANLGQLKTVFNFDIVAPQSPASLVVVLGSTQATLTWSESSTLVASYTVYESSSGGTTWSKVGTVSGNTTTTTVGSLLLGTNYSFEVVASNPSGASPNSAADSPPSISLTTPVGATLVP